MSSRVFDYIAQEEQRQQTTVELIASENFVSADVLRAVGSCLTNKYSEGYPARRALGNQGRYYGGCAVVDELEEYCIARWKEVFHTDYHVNVQPHSGSSANLAAYFALLQPGDSILSMSLSNGAHLTHGSPVNFSGALYNFVAYGVDEETGFIDYDKLMAQAMEVKPKLIVAGASAYAREIRFDKLREIADACGALLMVDMAHIAGLVAAGEHMNPVPYCDVMTTTTHKTLRGPRGGMILCREEYAKAIDKAVFPGSQGGPLMHVIAAKAVCFGEALTDEFKAYQHQIRLNAAALAKGLTSRGLKLVSGGTDNHLMLMDLRDTGITGKELEHRLDEVFITVNKNTIPNEPLSPFVTSGIRIGTPAVTSRGLKEADMDLIAGFISDAVTDFDAKADAVREGVTALCGRYPLY